MQTSLDYMDDMDPLHIHLDDMDSTTDHGSERSDIAQVQQQRNVRSECAEKAAQQEHCSLVHTTGR